MMQPEMSSESLLVRRWFGLRYVLAEMTTPQWASPSLSLCITSYPNSGGHTSAVHILLHVLSQVSVPRMTSSLVDSIMTCRSLRLLQTLWKFAIIILRFC